MYISFLMNVHLKRKLQILHDKTMLSIIKISITKFFLLINIQDKLKGPLKELN